MALRPVRPPFRLTQGVDEHGTLTFTAHASDPDSDAAETLTFGLDAGAPAGAAIDPVTGVFTWTPNSDEPPGVPAGLIRAVSSAG